MIGVRAPLLALVLFAAATAELLTGERELRGLQIAIAAAFIAPIAVRARFPWLPAVVQSLLATLLGALGLEPEATAEAIAILIAAYTAGALLEGPAAVRLFAFMAVGMSLNTVFLSGANDVAWVIGVFILPPWVAGRLMRSRREQEARLEALNDQLAQERDRTARLTAEAERLRIAGDIRAALAAGLHDITADAERLGTRPEPPGPDDFRRLREAGASTTAELRRLLGLLH